MRISDEIIEQVRTSNDIVDVISSYVKLKRRGKNYIGLCPFHQEKTPSFTVSAEKQMYHCFGCHKGGNVFTFVMEHEKVAFIEAVRSLAAKVGIVIPEGPVTEAQTEQESLYNACRYAGLQFHTNLTKSDEGRSALEYFHGRGFTDETIRTFGLGYSMNSWDNLISRAQLEGITTETLLKAGLVRKREDGSVYDYFRGRAMFPIMSVAGRVIGFGARKMREDDAVAGKYLNSPETQIYNKSRVLFGLFHSKEAIRGEEQALMVEGYADLISLYQAGIQNVVASSGTALTEDQLQLVGRYSKRLILLYDADSAGSDATTRGVDLALEQDFDVRVVRLPQGEDPDTYVRKVGGKEFREFISKSVSFIDFKAERYYQSGAFSTPEGKTEAVRSIVQSIAKMKDELKRNFYIKEVSQKYDVYETILYKELEKWIERDRKTTTRENIIERSAASTGRPTALQPALEEREVPPEERDLLKLLMEGEPELVDYIMANLALTDLSDTRVREAARLISEHRNDEHAHGMQGFVHLVEDEAIKELITDISLSKYELSKGWQTPEKEVAEGDPGIIARDALVRIKRRAIQREMDQNQKELREASQKGLDGMPFLRRQQELLQHLKVLDSSVAGR
jgi:DNA primase